MVDRKKDIEGVLPNEANAPGSPIRGEQTEAPHLRQKQIPDSGDGDTEPVAGILGTENAPSLKPDAGGRSQQSSNEHSEDRSWEFSIPLPDGDEEWSAENTAVLSDARSKGLPAALRNPFQHESRSPDFSSTPTIPDLQLEERIGQGGMGVVFRARDLKLNRQVAVKFLKLTHFADESELAQFQKEAETTARFSHNNIVQVYGCGVAGGWPYLVQEYISGGSLAAWLREKPMSVPLAVRWTSALARTIAAAHQSGIIHRDIKPANILLAKSPSSNEEDAIPKLTDFGLAKELGQDQTQASASYLVGTPGYLPPEQCGHNTQSVGPTADIFSLGATLYDMLTGRAPFKGSTTLETVELTRTKDPVAPSRLRDGIARDLDTICLKCLEKDPARRYATAEELALDLDRFLAGEPIRARPIGSAARLWKWSKRRPGLAALSLVSLTSIIAIVIGTIVYNRKLERALLEVTQESNKARLATELAQQKQALSERNLKVALDVIEQFITRFGEGGVAEIPEMQRVRALLATDVMKFLDGFSADEETAGDRTLLDLGQAYVRVGVMEHLIEQREAARRHIEKGIEILKKQRIKNPSDFATRQRLANAHGFLGSLLRNQSQNSEISAQLQTAIDLLKELQTEQPENRELKLQLAKWSAMQANYLNEPLRMQRLKFVAEHLEGLIAQDPGDREATLELASTLQQIVGANLSWGNVAEKKKMLERAQDMLSILLRDEVLQWKAHLYAATVCNSLGILARGQQDRKSAEKHFLEAIDHWEQLIIAFPRSSFNMVQATMPMSNLADIQQSRGALTDAEKTLKRAVQLCQQATKLDPTSIEVRGKTVHCMAALAAFYVTTNRPLIAEPEMQKIDQMLTVLCRDFPDNVEYRFIWMVHSLVGGRLNLSTNQIDRALKEYERADELIKFLRKNAPLRGDVISYIPVLHAGRASTLQKLGRLKESLADWEKAVSLSSGVIKQRYRIERLVVIAENGDHRRAKQEVDDIRKGPLKSAELEFDAAATYARCYRAAVADASLMTRDRDALAQQYRKQCLEILGGIRLIATSNRSAMLQSMDTEVIWESFRKEAVFTQLRAQMQKPAE